ncbi:MAG: CofH family radical SAM protein [Bacteroidales bacterium]|nr:CofH family radical SAM protein [Bacteroidales bacterium]
MQTDILFRKALSLGPLTPAEGLFLYDNAPLAELMAIGLELRRLHVPGNEVGWIIDRNVNITNICFSQCSFCNFCRKDGDADAYVTTMEEYREKIRTLFELGGDQLLLQGGMHPRLGLDFYTRLFSDLKSEFPALRLHALGPPEVIWLARKEKKPVREVLETLHAAGLDSLPGAGAEILSDRVRKIVSPVKGSTAQWLDVMREAHRMNLPTSATMMFGHAETPLERMEHLALLRELQSEKPDGAYGFVTFVPWPFQSEGTRLADEKGIKSSVTAGDYVRLVAVSRIMLNNIANIQSSLLTVGESTAMVTLHAGANDLGSVMIEENVVSSAGGGHRFDAGEIKEIIRRAGFEPRRRDQKYQTVAE